jgi:hypothetical protein
MPLYTSFFLVFWLFFYISLFYFFHSSFRLSVAVPKFVVALLQVVWFNMLIKTLLYGHD